jgi:predicted DNA-binding transcriptional regulator AlpA
MKAVNEAVLPNTGFLRLPQVCQFVPLGQSTIWRKVKTGDFPAPVKLGARTTAWKAEDIRAYIEKHGGGRHECQT